MEITSNVDQSALRLRGPSVSTNSILALVGPLSTGLGDGKAFQVGLSSEAFGRGQFYTDGSYGIGPGFATRDTFFSRLATSTLMVSSNRTTSGLANLTVTGKIGIGTTTPQTELEVIGTIRASNLLGGAANLSTDLNGNIIRDPSDQRLKTNIVDVEDALEKVLALRGVQYKWLDEERFGDQMEIGFIAQEVDEIVPEVVRKGGEYWSLNSRNLLAVVVEAIEDIWQTVTGNQEKIADLEERVQALESNSGIEPTPAPEPEPVEEEESEEDQEDDSEPDTVIDDTATSTDSNISTFEVNNEIESEEDLATEVEIEPDTAQSSTTNSIE